MLHYLTALPFALLPTLATAQGFEATISDCDWQASAWNLAEPWEENTRTFSEGKTRLALLDTIEPAAGWAQLLVLSPPYGELGSRQCKVIGINNYGFSGLKFDQLNASYEPATGLNITVPVQLLSGDSGAFVWRTLRFTLNQSTGAIRAVVQ